MSTITPLPAAPTRADPANFSARGDALMTALPTFVTETNVVAGEVNTNATTATTQAGIATNAANSAGANSNATGTSVTSLTIATGAQSFTTQSGKSWVAGMAMFLYNSAGNYMVCTVTSYSSTTLVLNCTSFVGTGTFTSWSVYPQLWYLEVPQNSQSIAYTLVLADAGKHLLHPTADTTARIFTIPANASVAYPIGTSISFVNQVTAGVLTIAITSDVMRLAGPGTTGSRTLAANGVATALKLTATEWIISGTNLT